MKYDMISTRKREVVSFEVDPRVTHKASGIAVARGCTTVDVLRGWIERTAGLGSATGADDEPDPEEIHPPEESAAGGSRGKRTRSTGARGVETIVNNLGKGTARSKRQIASTGNSGGRAEAKKVDAARGGKSPGKVVKPLVTKSDQKPGKLDTGPESNHPLEALVSSYLSAS